MTLPLYPNNIRGITWPVMKTHEFATTVQTARNFYTLRLIDSQNPIWHWTLIYEYLKDNPQDLVPALAPFTDYRVLEGFLLSLQGQFAEFLFDDVGDDAIGMNPIPGGSAGYPSSFKVNAYPTFESYYPAGTYVVDNNNPPHLQEVIVGGLAGTTVPTFSNGGGNTTSGGVTFHDVGVFPGINAQEVPVVMSNSVWYSPIQRAVASLFLEDITDQKTDVYPVLRVWDDGTLKTPGTDYTINGPGLAIPGTSYQGLYITWAGTPAGPVTIQGEFYFRCCIESDKQDIEQFLRQLWTIGGSSSKSGSGTLLIKSSRVARV